MLLLRALFATGVALTIGGIASAQTPRLVADINKAPVNLSSLPGGDGKRLWNFGAHTYFTAETTTHGRQLYRTVGTSATTVRLTALDPGVGISSPTSLAQLGNKMLFSGQGTTGEELYAVDLSTPTPTTALVKDIAAGSGHSSPRFLTTFKGFVYFRAFTSAAGQELWRSDGTATNTTMVKDIATGTGSSDPMGFTEFGGLLYFSAKSSSGGRELWRTDGTVKGTIQFADIYPGSADSSPAGFKIYKNDLYFSATDAARGEELYRTNGSTVTRVHDIRIGMPSSSPKDLIVFKGFLYFVALTTSVGRELCRTDGTTLKIFDLVKGATGSNPKELQVAGFGASEKLFMRAVRANIGEEIVFHDGANSLFIDVYAGSFSSFPAFLLGVPSGQLYFRAIGSKTSGNELWCSDGTPKGTRMLKDINPTAGQGSQPSYMSIDLLGQVFFSANDAVRGVELWTTNGTAAGTKLLADINQVPKNKGSNLTQFVDANGTLYFSALDATHGVELWKSDGTTTGTKLVKDLVPGPSSSTPNELVVVGKKLFFIANSPANGTELHCLDLTNDRITLIDVFPGVGGSLLYDLTAYRGKCWFGALHLTSGLELWCSDGTSSGTRLVKDIKNGSSSGYPREFTEHGGKLYFSANGPSNGIELWVTDGTGSGTREAVDVWKGSSSSTPRYMTSLGDRLIFSANSASGQEFFVSDGTSSGTQMFDIRSGSAGSQPNPEGLKFAQAGGNAYFSADDGTNGRELFVYDGTQVRLTRDIHAGTPGSLPNGMTAVGNRVVFQAIEGAGIELWASDGTVAGTLRLKDISPGPGSSRPDGLASIGKRRALFGATQPGSGHELYVTDGTPAGTRLLADISKGRLDSSPRSFTVVNDAILFRAQDQAFGNELFRIDMHGIAVTRGKGCRAGNAGPVLDSTDPVLGGTLGLSVRQAASSKAGMLLIGLRANAAKVLAFPGGCATWLDFTQPVLPFGFRTNASGSWSLNTTVPNDPNAIGLVFALQAGIGPTATPPLRTDLTNLLVLDFGR